MNAEVLALINIGLTVLLAIGGGVIGLYIKSVRASLDKLETADESLARKVSAVEVLIAGQYVTRVEFQHIFDRDSTERKANLEKLSDAIFRKLDGMEKKIDTKADAKTLEAIDRKLDGKADK